jgi:isochorismate pyruvate lyase
MTKPHDGRFDSLEEIRARIDEIDAEIVELIGQRAACVQEVVRFKTGPEDVHRPARVEDVVRKVRAHAADGDADPDLVETLYRQMIAWFTESEIKAFRDRVHQD